jgi:ankyrin repeat protein
MYGFIGIACLLLEKSAEVNAPPAIKEGRTALEGAAEHGRIDMLQLLLNRGAKVKESGEVQFNRALSFVRRQGYHAAAKLLQAFYCRCA